MASTRACLFLQPTRHQVHAHRSPSQRRCRPPSAARIQAGVRRILKDDLHVAAAGCADLLAGPSAFQWRQIAVKRFRHQLSARHEPQQRQRQRESCPIPIRPPRRVWCPAATLIGSHHLSTVLRCFFHDRSFAAADRNKPRKALRIPCSVDAPCPTLAGLRDRARLRAASRRVSCIGMPVCAAKISAATPAFFDNDFPCDMMATRSATRRTSVRSCVISSTAMLNTFCAESLISARICACMVTSSAVVGSSAMNSFGTVGDRHGDSYARWRSPPES